jgi:hypothetical protein
MKIHPALLYGGLLLAGISLTLASLKFVRPNDCQRCCNPSLGIPCTQGACQQYEQRAGLPLPVLVDAPGGGSPTSGWCILGPEDMPNPLTFLLDVLFYGLVLWMIGSITLAVRQQTPLNWLEVALPLAVIIPTLVAGFILYRPLLAR